MSTQAQYYLKVTFEDAEVGVFVHEFRETEDTITVIINDCGQIKEEHFDRQMVEDIAAYLESIGEEDPGEIVEYIFGWKDIPE